MSELPSPKKRRVNNRKKRPPSNVVLRLSKEVCNYLNVQEILKLVTIPELSFLKDEECQSLLTDTSLSPAQQSSKLLHFLKMRDDSRREEDFRMFMACVEITQDVDRGHSDLSKMFQAKLPEEEWILVQKIKEDSETPLPSPYTTPPNSPHVQTREITLSPERPMTLITLQGSLVEETFLNLSRELWVSFSKGNYDDLQFLILDMKNDCGKHDPDSKVVALWFESLILMHRHKDYDRALSKLDDATELTGTCVNKGILKGRILQRKAQVYLMMGKKINGAELFKQAKEQLQFVGRGYDKTNMYCREAKMMSATEPDRRDDIEKIYQVALSTLEKDDPYFLASYPSVTLSKAAFHLHLAFGSKPATKEKLPLLTTGDVLKAKETLSGFVEEEHILIDMRRLEYDLLQAELCRVEGKAGEARSRFTRLKKAAGKVGNIADIAEHRLKWIPAPLNKF